MEDNDLTQIIRSLIASDREGIYWDFKELPSENKASLLHDIICLANALHKGTRYLIFGVAESPDGFKVTGLSNGQANRIKQSQLANFMREKRFLGDIRPTVEMRTIKISGKELDVILIFDLAEKPYCLREDFKDRGKTVKAYHIYTRNLDTNTPIDSSANLWQIENLWRERFGLDLPPRDRLKQLLRNHGEWIKDIGNKNYMYHQSFSEYTIELFHDGENEETFNFFYLSPKSSGGRALFKYQSTILFEEGYLYLDEARIMLPHPLCQNLRYKGKDIYFYFYVLNTVHGGLLNILTDGTFEFKSRGSGAPFLIFKDNEERKEFIDYFGTLQNPFDNIQPFRVASIAEKPNKYVKEMADYFSKIAQIHARWRVKKKKPFFNEYTYY